ncbi:hypothetical protein Tsp_07005 [Trichinella spiralis]|uniref:hypothetical protein n=1 Tax=Trichinella spiralis TaxID=6334 RepID=UPI0001EFB45D|nr:hypothetical protein Tsp_07005 [Trichinella spiralis]
MHMEKKEEKWSKPRASERMVDVTKGQAALIHNDDDHVGLVDRGIMFAITSCQPAILISL